MVQVEASKVSRVGDLMGVSLFIFCHELFPFLSLFPPHQTVDPESRENPPQSKPHSSSLQSSIHLGNSIALIALPTRTFYCIHGPIPPGSKFCTPFPTDWTRGGKDERWMAHCCKSQRPQIKFRFPASNGCRLRAVICHSPLTLIGHEGPSPSMVVASPFLSSSVRSRQFAGLRRSAFDFPIMTSSAEDRLRSTPYSRHQMCFLTRELLESLWRGSHLEFQEFSEPGPFSPNQIAPSTPS
jgi:hypothetical protein